MSPRRSASRDVDVDAGAGAGERGGSNDDDDDDDEAVHWCHSHGGLLRSRPSCFGGNPPSNKHTQNGANGMG